MELRMDAIADADDDQDSRCSASQYVQVRPPEPRILFQNRSYLSLTVRGYTTQSAFCNLGVVMMMVVVMIVTTFCYFFTPRSFLRNVPFDYLLLTIKWEGLTRSQD